MKKGITITLIVLGIIVIALAGAFFALTKDSDTVAYLYITQGSVEVDLGSGFEPATDEMLLKKGAVVRTGADGLADIVFFEQDVMSLDSNTQVVISVAKDSHVSIKQETGSTWNRVEKLAGREYTVETPNSVATVRGTGFLVEEDFILVDDGQVDVEDKETGTTEQITAGELLRRLQSGELSKEELSVQDLLAIREYVEKDVETLKKIRLRAIMKNRFLYEQAKARYGFTDAKAREFLNDLDTGKRSIAEVEQRIPVHSQKIEKLKRITLRIKALNDRLERIDARIAQLS